MSGARFRVPGDLVVAFDPETVLFAASSRPLIAWRPGPHGASPLAEHELLLLADVLAGEVPDRADGAPHAGVADLARRHLVCAEGEDGAREPLTTAPLASSPPRDAHDSAAAEARTIVPWNIAFRPARGGFAVWSARRRAHVLVPREALAVLLGFVGGAAVAGDERAAAWVRALVDAGLLIEHDESDWGSAEKVSAGEVLRMAVVEGMTGASALEAIPSLPLPAPSPSRKTPVYLVYCTSNLDARVQLPLALGMLVAHAKAYRGGLLLEHYDFVNEFLHSAVAVKDAVAARGPGVVLFSDYLWTIDENLDVSRALKALSADFVTIHGGPSVPKYEAKCDEFLHQHPHVDVAVRGEGEGVTAELLAALAAMGGKRPNKDLLGDIAGISFVSSAGATVRTRERERERDIDSFPSPYLTGVFDASRLDIVSAAVLETNRGCPYQCTFCDWGSAIAQKIASFDIERVRAEIEWIASRKIPILWCADANFGIFERDVAIAEMIADAKRRHGYPRQLVVNYAKNATVRLADILRILRDAGVVAEGIISIQTTDADTLRIVRRSNIKTERYDELTGIFRDLKLPLSSDLIMGLPGATVASFRRDLQLFFDREVLAKAYRARLLPNSPMADPEYMAKYEIRTDKGGFLCATSTYSAADLSRMMRIYKAYDAFVCFGLLYYVLRYLQWDHGISALDFIDGVDRVTEEDPARYPAITWVLRPPRNEQLLSSEVPVSLHGWRPFLDAVAAHAGEAHGIARDAAFEAVLRFQEAVVRDLGRVVPETVPLDHDVVAYFQAARRRPANGHVPLREFPPATVEVTDPDQLCRMDPVRHREYDSHLRRWELVTPLSELEYAPFFIQVA